MTHYRAQTLALSIVLGVLSLSAQADTIIRTTSYEYDTAGLMTKEVIEPNLANSCLQTTYTHDGFGNRTGASSTPCAGAVAPATNSATVARTKADSYGADGRFPVTSTNALNQSETKAYDARFGTLTSLTGPNALATTWTYDSFGRKTRENRVDGTYTTWTYKLCTDAGANCPATVGPASVIWVSTEQSFAVNLAVNSPEKRQYFDTLNRVVRTQTQGFDGTVAAPTLVQDVEYTNLGQVKHQSNWYALPGGTPVWTEFTYDVQGRTLTESRPDTVAVGGIATTTWAYNGLSVTVTNANGQTKTTTRNAQGQVALVTDAQGSTIAYSYDAQGNLLSTHAAGSITSMGYDIRGNKTTMLDPAMGSWTYSYNAYGELVAQRDSLNQSVTMVYDLLGRMTKRTEPDLVSDWSYDNKFDGNSCGTGAFLGRGRLCEARSDNGYNRKHTYDAMGRILTTATVLDNAGAPATVSETFDANTGRVSTKTWPTGYMATYGYTPLGYLKTVSGSGAGSTHSASYDVLAMNPQGQITQYRYGNNVTTVKSFDANTNRLMGQSATLDGQGTGNVLNHSYTYDAVGNLQSRNDATPGVGTQEGFSYDSLNRLTMASLTSTAVGSIFTEVMYDPRGNITYKSDTGRYWYDPARPNRITAVTRETAPGASIPYAGKLALSYAFDDLKAGSQTVNGTLMGNGNLEYTVRQDMTPGGSHTVRWEAYTSYNMPLRIDYANFSVNTTSCLAGYALVGASCVKTVDTVNPATANYTCLVGTTLSGSNCVATSTSSATQTSTCPAGYSLSGTVCTTSSSTAATQTLSCASPTALSNGYCTVVAGGCANPLNGMSLAGVTQLGAGQFACKYNRISSYSCPAGQSLSGTSCILTSTVAPTASYSCPAGQTLSGSTCTATNTTAASATYSCPSGQTLSGSTCVQTTTLTTTPGTTPASADRTLSFIYGPEHQRIRQTVALTGSGTSSYFAGSTWYLNGEDSLGLSYEKEIRANGTTEHKHYVRAGEAVFALFTSRTGSLNGLPATTNSYFHQDHLGSIAAITSETGAVTERLAYDPWGKRRFIATVPGTSDTQDAIVGNMTDRGYTMHEHLDEIGVVHMNGRIYDPLIGRFMSADPIIQDPENLKSFNRYSYVWNNPLKNFDPTGFINQERDDAVEFGGERPSATDGRTTTTTYSDGWTVTVTGGTPSYASGRVVTPLSITAGYQTADIGPAINAGANSILSFLTLGYSNEVSRAIRTGDWISAGLATTAGAAAALGNAATLGTGGLIVNGIRTIGPVVGPRVGVWSLNPFKRGQEIERALGQNLPGNFPVIDKFENGIATSIKSLDVNAVTYQNAATLSRTVMGYIDSIANFAGRSWAGANVPGSSITGRALDLAVPGAGSAAQQSVLNQAIEYGASRGVTVNVITFP